MCVCVRTLVQGAPPHATFQSTQPQPQQLAGGQFQSAKGMRGGQRWCNEWCDVAWRCQQLPVLTPGSLGCDPLVFHAMSCVHP
eukprot:13393340-Alexandrium_andersonii.AAC.1